MEAIFTQIMSYLSDKPIILISFILTVTIFSLNKKLNINVNNLKSLLLFWLVWFFLYSPQNFPNISEGIATMVASWIILYCIYLLTPKKYVDIIRKNILRDDVTNK